eukprot:6124332-Prymnesium_polylepis.1
MKPRVIPQGGVEAPPPVPMGNNFEWKKLVDARFKAPSPCGSATASIASSSSSDSRGPGSSGSSTTSTVGGGGGSRLCFWDMQCQRGDANNPARPSGLPPAS